MAESESQQSVEAAIAAELTLIADEEKAVKKLAAAQRKLDAANAKLQKARKEADRQQAGVEKAQQALQIARERHASGGKPRLLTPEPDEPDPGPPTRD